MYLAHLSSHLIAIQHVLARLYLVRLFDLGCPVGVTRGPWFKNLVCNNLTRTQVEPTASTLPGTLHPVRGLHLVAPALTGASQLGALERAPCYPHMRTT